MPELPEIVVLASQLRGELVGKRIEAVRVRQPKVLNLPEAEFAQALVGATVIGSEQRGKWALIETDRGWLALNQGLGGEVLLVRGGDLPEKWRVAIAFDDGDRLAISFAWVGHAHYVPPGALASHPMIGKLGVDALSLGADDLRALVGGRRGRIKSYLLDQSLIAGIGNAYIHDILFMAGLHPLRAANTLTDSEFDALARAIHDSLRASIEKGGSVWDVDLYGRTGAYGPEDMLVGYKAGQPCPRCGAQIAKIKTGSTSSYICPRCQAT
jgi:formamidopyrimidine-DNA glycosylase